MNSFSKFDTAQGMSVSGGLMHSSFWLYLDSLRQSFFWRKEWVLSDFVSKTCGSSNGHAELFIHERLVVDFLITEWASSSHTKQKAAIAAKKNSSSRQSSISVSGLGGSSSRSSNEFVIRRSPNKKGKFVRAGQANKMSNVYSIRIKNGEFLLVFAEDGPRAFTWGFPGTQRKAWCTAFEKDLKDERAWPVGESPISSIVKRRDIRDNTHDNPLAQKTSTQYYMTAFLCFMGPDDTPASISNSIVRKINEYSSDRNNNMKYFRYHGEVTETLGNENLHALDYWVITSDVVDTVNNVYDDELNDGTFFQYTNLVDALFERTENTRDIRSTLSGTFHHH